MILPRVWVRYVEVRIPDQFLVEQHVIKRLNQTSAHPWV